LRETLIVSRVESLLLPPLLEEKVADAVSEGEVFEMR
jgi:hypothetical protein